MPKVLKAERWRQIPGLLKKIQEGNS